MLKLIKSIFLGTFCFFLFFYVLKEPLFLLVFLPIPIYFGWCFYKINRVTEVLKKQEEEAKEPAVKYVIIK